jgi:hypothetical protein
MTPVFVVGFPRCGSSSLCAAMRILGWNAIHNPRSWDQVQGHDCAGDLFVTAHWRDLYAMFPEGKFILNTRDFSAWADSLTVIDQFWAADWLFNNYYRQRVYGTKSWDDRTALRRAWDKHHAEVFTTIPGEQLLVFEQPFTWGPLCRFLGVNVPAAPFPWLNRGTADYAENHIEK